MASSSLAGPLPPSSSSNDCSLSPQPPNPPPPSTKGQKSPTVPPLGPLMRNSEGEREQSMTATKSQRQFDFLPPEMLQVLKQPQPRKARSSPPATHGQRGNILPFSLEIQQSPKKDNKYGLPPIHPPANMWSYPMRRSKFSHLMTHPPCVCGAGSDISFLYDVPEDLKGAGQSEVPHTLIPEEYHIHKRLGVVGLELDQDQYTTKSHAHDAHVTIFPSMKPGGRYEVMALKNTMDMMLEKAGVPRDGPELDGPTQAHNLLELVRMEQVIYNMCFHEIIRQVSVQCAERGELLQEIRSRYAKLLDRIPRQVMSLHNDVVSQRTLYRRLLTEAKRFKSKIASITERLGELKDIDTDVVEETELAHKELSTALTESEKHANLADEYHRVYELQRKRLQESVDKLRWERDLWQGAVYGLAGEVAETLLLRTLRRLQLGEKAWTTLARHFTTLLSSHDIQQLREVDECVRRWREGVMSESGRLEEMENDIKNRLSVVEESMKIWCEKLRNRAAADGRVAPLDQSERQQLWEELKVWLGTLNCVSDVFAGEALLSRMESLQTLNHQVEQWTQVALEVFSRHQEMNRFDHAPSDHTHSPEHQTMLSLGSDIDVAMKCCTTRISGDNGVAVGLIHLITPLETWEGKLTTCRTTDREIPDSDWNKLGALVREWLEQLQRIRGCIGTVTSDSGQPLQCAPMSELSVAIDKWRSALFHAITARDSKIDSMVTDMHSALVLWMVQLLLTSTHKCGVRSTSRGEEEREGVGEDSDHEEGEAVGETEEEDLSEEDNWDLGMGLTSVLTVDLKNEYETLSNSLTRLTTSLTRCVSVLVERDVDVRRRDGDPNADEEKRLLEELRKEARQWVEQAALLTIEVEKSREERPEEGEREDEPAKVMSEAAEVTESESRSGLPEEVFVMGKDLNIHPKLLQHIIDETPQPILPTLTELGLYTEEELPEGRGYQERDTETLALRLEHARSQLEEQEKLTRQERERAETAEKQLDSSRAHLSALEAELLQVRAELEQFRDLHATKTTGRGMGGRGGKRGRGGGGRPSSRK